MVLVTSVDEGSVVSVTAGDTLEAHLPERPTTGFRWAVDSMDPAILGLEGTEFQSRTDAGVGSSGVRILRFQVRAAGRSELRLKEWREWEGDSSIVHRFAVTVVSEDPSTARR